MDYKVGDKVRIVDNSVTKSFGVLAGDIGVIQRVGEYNYDVYIPRIRTHWTFQAKRLEKVKEEEQNLEKETGSLPVVYKQVAIRDGRYWSCFVGVPGVIYNEPDYQHPAIEYKIGEVAKTLPGTVGIFCRISKEEALNGAKERWDMRASAGLPAVLECYPIGASNTARGSGVQYPAVFVIREIWRETTPKAVYKWVDVTWECTYAPEAGGRLVCLKHNNLWLIEFGYDKPRFAIRSDYKIEDAGESRTSGLRYFRILRRQEVK